MQRPESISLPTNPGIYLYKDAGGRIIYVGKARNLRSRILSYFRDHKQLSPKTIAMLSHAESLDTLTTGTEKEALLLEASLIKKHRPRYNILLRDDKQYVLFRIDRKHPFPRLEVVRQSKRDGARYFGPFTSALAARETWKSIHRAVALRRCTDKAMKNRVRPCLYHHIGQCLAPCKGLVSHEEYMEQINRVEMLLSGKSRHLVTSLTKAMQEASETLDFEKAATLRDQIRAIERTVEQQSVVLPEGGDADIIGIVPASEGLALGILFVRGGKLLDKSTFFWPGLNFAESPELLWSFIGQFYGPLHSPPPRIVCPWLPGSQDTQQLEPQDAAALAAEQEDSEASLSRESLEAVLAEWSESPVRLSLPKNHAERQLVAIAESNAIEAGSKEAHKVPHRLAQMFERPEPVLRVECVDVSHTAGAATRVGMVVFQDTNPATSDHRTYTVDAGGDDYKALGLWMQRRLDSGPPWPDLLLVDGGRGQVAAVAKVCGVFFSASGQTQPFALAGIAKAQDEHGRADRRAGNVADRIFVPGRSNPLPLRHGSQELLFLQHVRDTAHKYVIGKHRKARSKASLSSQLTSLSGIGEHTARLLWQHFDSVEAMLAASPEQLTKIPGIGKLKAKALAERLRTLGG